MKGWKERQKQGWRREGEREVIGRRKEGRSVGLVWLSSGRMEENGGVNGGNG